MRRSSRAAADRRDSSRDVVPPPRTRFVAYPKLSAEVVATLRGARHSIALMCYTIDEAGVITALVEAIKKKLEVRVLIDWHQAAGGTTRNQMSMLQNLVEAAEAGRVHLEVVL